MQKAGGAFFLQAGKDGHGVFRAGDAGDVGGIQKGLQLQKYEVGQLLCGGGGLCIPAHIGQDAVDHVFIVGFGSADATIHYAAAKAVGKARAVVARHGIGIITVVQGVDGRDHRRQAAQRGQQQQRRTAGRLHPGRAAEQKHHARNQRGHGQDDQRNLPPGDIGLRDGEIAYEDDEIIEVQRGNAHQADAAIHNGQHHPNRADQGIGEPAPLYQQSQGQRAGNQQRVVQKGQRTRKNIACGGDGIEAANGLGNKAENQRQQQTPQRIPHVGARQKCAGTLAGALGLRLKHGETSG